MHDLSLITTSNAANTAIASPVATRLCGAAAGIAAVFNVPLGGVIFVLDVVLRDYSVRSLLPLMNASMTASTVNRYAGTPAVRFPEFHVAGDKLLCAPILGLAAGNSTRSAERRTQGGRARRIWAMYRDLALGTEIALYLMEIRPPLNGAMSCPSIFNHKSSSVIRHQVPQMCIGISMRENDCDKSAVCHGGGIGLLVKDMTDHADDVARL